METKELEQEARKRVKREEAQRRDEAMRHARAEIEQQQAETDRAAAVEQAKSRLQAMDRSRLDAARERAHEALDQYADAIDAWNQEIAELTEETHNLGSAVKTTGRMGHLEIDGVTGRREGLQRAFGTLALQIARAHQPYGFISFDQPED